MSIEGLTYTKRFITKDQEKSLIEFIDSQPWNTSLSRRTQHYGYKYSYRHTSEEKEDLEVPKIPKIFLDVLGDSRSSSDPSLRDLKSRFGELGPNQVIVNEYNPSQGIAAHIDDVRQFGDTICSLSLLTGIEMEFANRKADLVEKLYLRPRSMLWLTGEARYRWTHQIRGRKFDTYKGEKKARGRRVSITYRVKRGVE